MKITAEEIIKKIDEALKQFGEYSYTDKGADEVMDISEIGEKLKELSTSEIISILEKVEKKHRRPEPFLSEVCMYFQDWEDKKADELFNSKLFGKYY